MVGHPLLKGGALTPHRTGVKPTSYQSLQSLQGLQDTASVDTLLVGRVRDAGVGGARKRA